MHVYFPNWFDIFLQMAMREFEQILNLIKCGSVICNRRDQSVLASRFFHLAKSLWNQGTENINYRNNYKYMFIY